MAKAKDDFGNAFETGDKNLVASAQEKIAKLAAQATFLETTKAKPAAPAPEQQPAPRPPDQRAVKWFRENPWFGTDNAGRPVNEMSAMALNVHTGLVNEGVNPTEDTYYERLNKSMRAMYPDKFTSDDGDADTPAPAPAPKAGTRAPAPPVIVAPATRGSAAPRRVQLSATQVALANKLGISVEDYAKEVLAEEERKKHASD